MDSFALERLKEDQALLIRKVYAWMCAALLITAISAYITAGSETLMSLVFGSRVGFWVLILSQLGIVWYLTSRITSMSLNAVSLMFVLYSVLTGVTLSYILLVYTQESIVATLLITAGTFGAMSIYGFTTKNDLSSYGSLFFMGMIGLIIASVVNYFLQSTMLHWVISCVGVLIFVGLTAYDTQKIKALLGQPDTEMNQKIAILGALTLYLDFINLFIYLLQLFGRKK